MSTLRPRLRRAAALAMLLALTLPASGTGCKKSADSIEPGDGGGGTADVAGGVAILYKAGAYKLKQDARYTLKITSPEGVDEVKIDTTGLVDVSDAGGGKLKVAYSVAEVRQLDLSKPPEPPKDGQPPVDPKAALMAATGAEVVDLHGDLDKEATKALPENAAKKEPQRNIAGLIEGLASSFLGLPPQLPPKPLPEGAPVKISKREKQQTPLGIELEMDSTTTFTLVKIDASSGKRVAEIKFESESSGAREEGKRMITADAAVEGVLLFNLDDQLPAHLTLSSTYNMSAGEGLEFELRNTIDSTFSPA